MSRKALIVANTGRFIALFEIGNIRILKGLGYEVHCFASFQEDTCKSLYRQLDDLGVTIYDAEPFRSPYRPRNILVYRQLKNIMRKNRYDFVDCHTPMGGVLARLAAKSTGTGPVQYTAHGFHFYEGAPIQNWLFYYPVERFLSRCTDTLITINREDYERAKTFHAKRVIQIPGVGFHSEKYRNLQIDPRAKREELGIPSDAFLIVSVGELNRNKNHRVILEAISAVQNFAPYYLICGEGPESENLKRACVRLNLQRQVLFPGFREDVAEILKCSDCFAFPSRREGLGMAALEAMASGLPLITSDASGILEYSENGKTGFVCAPDDVRGFAGAILRLLENRELGKQMGRYNREAVQKFGRNHVNKIMSEIYSSQL
jgi:glycosyltransferase involved in cell wall biosynthesis